jgi:hypothetical protein
MLVRFLPLFAILFFPLLKGKRLSFARRQDFYNVIRKQTNIPMAVFTADALVSKCLIGNWEAVFVSPFKTVGHVVRKARLLRGLDGKAGVGK